MRKLCAFVALLAPWLGGTVAGGAEAAMAAGSDATCRPRVEREIFVPLADLNLLLSAGPERVFVSRAEFDALLAKARAAAQPQAPRPAAAIVSAEYAGQIEENRARFEGTLVVDGGAGPSAIELDLSAVALRRATLDDQPAALGAVPGGRATLFVPGPGRHVLNLEFMAPVEAASAVRVVTFQIPTPPATRLRLSAPGDVELKSGGAVIRRTVDAERGVTTFELLPRAGLNTLALSLNNRQLQQDALVVAHAVLADQITSADERLSATVSLAPLHGAVEEFRFVVPDGFEVTGVAGPQVARWSVVAQAQRAGRGGANARTLTVRLSEATTETVSLRISALRAGAFRSDWTLPRLTALDVVGQATVIGLLVDSRLAMSDLAPRSLIPVDVAALERAIPAEALAGAPGSAPLRTVAAFYAPLGDYGLAARLAAAPGDLRVTANLLLTLEERAARLSGGLSLARENEKLFDFELVAPAGWQVTEITTGGAGTGIAIPLETRAGPNGTTRLSVRLPQAGQPGEPQTVYFRAIATDPGWLDDWQIRDVAFPVFRVSGAARETGAIAIAARDDLAARPGQVERLTPLDASEKSKFGLDEGAGDLAYQYDSPPYTLSLTVSRMTPRVTARVASFFVVEPELFVAHYEIAYEIAEARLNRLRFALPVATPAELSVSGLDGVTLTESSSVVAGAMRQWTVLVGEPQRGTVRLAIDFQQPRDTAAKPAASGAPAPAAEIALPLARALDVAYQTGVVSVEGSAEQQAKIKTMLRRIDVGELAEADYQPGRRLVGAFGYAGEPGDVRVATSRPPGYELPAAIVERAELLTVFSASGRSQTAARFLLRSKASLVEVRLPKRSTLWSAHLNGQPALPQSASNSALKLNLPAAVASPNDLQLVYETPTGELDLSSGLKLAGPQLFLTSTEGRSTELPLADVVWRVATPAGFEIVRSEGSLFSDQLRPRESPISAVKNVLTGLTSILAPIQSAREVGRIALADTKIEPTELTVAAPMEADSLSQAEKKSAAFGVDEFAAKERAEARAPSNAPGAEAVAKSPAGAKEKDAVDELRRAGEPAGGAGQAPGPPSATAPAAGENKAADDPFGGVAQQKRQATAKSEMLRWALEGIRSLPIELQAAGPVVTFRSLGRAPALELTVVDRGRFALLAWGVGLLTFVVGARLARQPLAQRMRFLALTLVLSLAAPLALPWSEPLAPACDAAFYAGCWLAAFYLIVAIARRLARLVSRRASGRRAASAPAVSASAVIASAGIVIVACVWQAVAPGDCRAAEPVERPIHPPADAILVPYDPAKEDPLANPRGLAGRPDQKIGVPYDRYLELQRIARGDGRPVVPPPAEFALAGADYTARLGEGEWLVVEGHLDVESFVDHAVAVPLALAGGALIKADWNGKPARLVSGGPGPATTVDEAKTAKPAAARPAAKPLRLLVEGRGRGRLELAMRFGVERRGGWAIARGTLPATAATALTLAAPQAGLEVLSDAGVDRRRKVETRRDGETIETALAPDGKFDLQWRRASAVAPVESGLSATTTAALDVQEDGLRATWSTRLNFPRGQRDAFTLAVPAEYLVESVTGLNVRGWRSQDVDGRRQLEITLLKTASEAEQFSVRLARRGAVGIGDLAAFEAPVVEIIGAAQQSGELTIRRSPLLELRTDRTSGATRSDNAPTAEADGDSPLGILSYQTYRFGATPFVVKLTAQPAPARVVAQIQTVLKASPRRPTLESLLRIDPRGRPLFNLRVELPGDWRLDHVRAPEPFQWALTPGAANDRQTVDLYFAAGQRQPFEVVLSGPLGAPAAAPADRAAANPAGNNVPAAEGWTFTLPQLRIATPADPTASVEQSGEIAVQTDPGFGAQAEGLERCELGALSDARRWLAPAQQRLARLVVRYRGADYAGKVRVWPRAAVVQADSVTNVRVTDRTVEETILLDFTIRGAGVRSLSFLLPAALRDARVSVPLLRQKTVEPVDGLDGWARVRVELQDAVMDNLRVLVEHDQLLTSGQYSAPIPRLETGETRHRYVTLESAGRDEVVVDAHAGVAALSPEQDEWRMLTGLVGRGLTEAWLVEPGADRPLLAVRAQDRAAVKTVGARIGLAKATLTLDAAGAYRAAQLYRIDNSLEQYLEVELPAGARLWTAHVAGEPVKPVATPDERIVRIPLVKTATGDSDYPVALKYGGELGRMASLGRVDFPLVRTRNINVELSQVELRVPDEFRWFDFGGTMRLVEDEGDLAAGLLMYCSRQMGLAVDSLHSKDPFTQARARNNLRQLLVESESLKQSAQQYGYNLEVARELRKNAQIQQGLADEASLEAGAGQEALGNRVAIADAYRSQSNTRANDALRQAGGNFVAPESMIDQPAAKHDDRGEGQGPARGKGQAIDKQWLERNQLDFKGTNGAAPATDGERRAIRAPQPAAQPAPQEKPGLAVQSGDGPGFGVAERSGGDNAARQTAQREDQAASNAPQRQLQRYERRLAEQAKQLGLQTETLTLDASNSMAKVAGQLGSDREVPAQRLTGKAFGGRGAGVRVGRRADRAEGMGGVGGMGVGGGAGPDAAAAAPAEKAGGEATLASLDVTLPERGKIYRFTTPRGDVGISARIVSAPLVGRAGWLAALALAAFGWSAGRRRWQARTLVAAANCSAHV